MFLASILLAPTLSPLGPVRTLRVRTPDGVTIAIQEWGNPKARPVILIHGLLQSHLSWVKQTGGSFAKRYRVITYDLRGHGESDAPTAARYYQTSAAWASELRAVIRATHAEKPILVGWSMGGVVISDYLKTYGTANLSGLVYLDSWVKAPEAQMRSNGDVIVRMASPNLQVRIDARTAFLHACFFHQPSANDFTFQLAFNMLTPPKALGAMVNRDLDYDAVAHRTKLPVLVYHGDHDLLMAPSVAEHTAKAFPNARLVIAKNVGHASFYEDPGGFEKAFDAFLANVR